MRLYIFFNVQPIENVQPRLFCLYIFFNVQPIENVQPKLFLCIVPSVM